MITVVAVLVAALLCSWVMNFLLLVAIRANTRDTESLRADLTETEARLERGIKEVLFTPEERKLLGLPSATSMLEQAVASTVEQARTYVLAEARKQVERVAAQEGRALAEARDESKPWEVEDCGRYHDWSAKYLDQPRRGQNKLRYGDATDGHRAYVRKCRDCGHQNVQASNGAWVDD